MKDKEITLTKPKRPGFENNVNNPDAVATLPEGTVGFLTIIAGSNSGQTYPLKLGKTVIGRGSGCAIQLADTQVSRHHLEIVASADSIIARDLKTTNGTFIGGKTIIEQPLSHGDEISLGLTTLHFALTHKGDGLGSIEHLYDHDSFINRLDEEIDRAYRFQRHLTIAMLHVIDDQVKTAEIAQKILAGVRTMDLLATYGRRDLELMLPETNKEDARQLMQNLLRQLKKQLNSNMPLRIGLASFPVEATTRHQLIETARQPIWMEQSNPQLGEISDRGNASLNSSLTGLSQQGTTPSASLIDEKIILHSPKMRELYQTAMRIASTPISVMIQGETGTGKELVAESIHLHSDRANKQFLAINCGAFTVNLLESELFGHERGSFTGADQRKIGLLEAVKGGTLFMDEIGEIPPPLQVKLLRVLQDNMIRRVGGTEMIQVNFRVVSATNRNIRKMVEQGTFREDLYYRLNAIILEVPPLRERLEEIPHIAKFFLDQYKAAYHKNDLKFSKAAQEALQQYHWPGNVRELKNCMERAVVTTEGNIVFPENLNLPTARQATPRPHFKQSSSHTSKGNIGDTIAGAMRPQLDDYEKQLIVSALQKTNWNQTKASTLLKIPRRTLVSKIKKFGIVKP